MTEATIIDALTAPREIAAGEAWPNPQAHAQRALQLTADVPRRVLFSVETDDPESIFVLRLPGFVPQEVLDELSALLPLRFGAGEVVWLVA